MIFFVANDGTIIKGLPSPVYQGAANTNTIYLIAPFATNTAVTVAFQLPNGVWTKPVTMTAQNALKGIVNEVTGQTYAGWTYDLPNEITTYYGTVTAQFFFYSAQAGVITATSSTSFQVGRGVPAVLPETPSEDIYGQILSNFAALQTQLNNGSFAARSIYAWNSSYTYGANEITFYPEIGEYGAFVQSVQTGNTNHVPYVDGAIDSAWWKEVVNFNNITEEYLGELNAILSAAQAAQSAAEAAESNAKASEDAAKGYSNTAQGAALQATTKAGEALTYAANAETFATAAQNSVYSASEKASDAEGFANAAKGSAEGAAESATQAQDSANRAQEIVDGIGAVYRPVGSIAFAQLPAVLTESELGYVYNITDDFVTDSRFVEGAGKSYPAGSNVAVILSGTEYKYDILSGIVDLSNYAKQNGSYPNMTVGNAIKAMQDGDGLNISQNYVKSVAQDLTAVQQEQARGNIGAGVPRNLFYNGDFRLNTLGQSEYVDDGNTYVPCIDGWEFGYGDCTLEVLESGGVKITKETGEVNPTNFQSKDIKDGIAHAGSYTVSFGVDTLASIQQQFIFYVTKEGKTVYVSATVKNDTENNIAIRTFTLTEEQVSAIRQSTRLVIGIQKRATVESMTIYGAKLEEGKKSTYPNGITNNATKAQYSEKAASATQDGNGNNIADTYAKQNGTYSGMTVGNANKSLSATADNQGNVISSTYAKKVATILQSGDDLNNCVPDTNGEIKYWYCDALSTSNAILNTPNTNFNRTFYLQVSKVWTGDSDYQRVIQTLYDIRGNIFTRGLNKTSSSGTWESWSTIFGSNNRTTPTRENLLINPNFAINQRAASSYTESSGSYKYSVDRWRINKSTLTVNSDNVTVTASESDIPILTQTIENWKYYSGKRLTLTVNVTAVTGSFMLWFSNGNTVAHGSTISSSGTFSYSVTIQSSNMTELVVGIYSKSADCSVTVEYMKLEESGVSTPYESPDTATELLKCQRYYQRISLAGATGAATSTNILNVSASLTTTMCKMPSLTIITNPVFYGNSSSYNFTSATVAGLYNNSILLGFLISSSLTLQNVYAASSGLVELDAEI